MSGTAVVIQARVGSRRLPRKVLTDLAGRPLLAHVITRAQAIKSVDHVIVATTTSPADAAVLDLARQCGAVGFAGSENDVLDRYYRAALEAGAETVLRVTGDCPLLDPSVSGLVLQEYLRGHADYVSNIDPPSYPDGLDTEVFSFAALARAWREARLPSEREHVTPYIRNRKELFRTSNVTHPTNLSTYRWTVDDPADLEFVRAVLGRAPSGNILIGMVDVLKIIQAHPEIEAHYKDRAGRNEGYQASLKKDQPSGSQE